MNGLYAEAISFNKIQLKYNHIDNLEIDKIAVFNNGKQVSIASCRLDNDVIIIELKEQINIKAQYLISYYDIKTPIEFFTLFGTEEFYQKYNCEKALGIVYTNNYTEFNLWSPAASSVYVRIYENYCSNNNESFIEISMAEDNGYWTAAIMGDLNGKYYTYSLNVYNHIREIVDPYAYAVGANGLRGAIIDLKQSNPENFESDMSPELNNYTDAVIYEMSIRDISSNEHSGVINKRKFLGLAEENTVNKDGLPTALNHIKDLGVTHIQLMPVFDFSYKSVDELNPVNYNWGYDPQNYNVPEGSYCSDPANPITRIYELKKLIQVLHKNSISVVMDVVYNHIFNFEESNLENLFPSYFFRRDKSGNFSSGSGCGNDLASERFMVRRLIVDSVKYWAKEYHIDGFRFDLMGILDVETMNEIEHELHHINKNIILYGEGWELSTEYDKNNLASIKNASKTPKIAYFNDFCRDNIKGSVFNEMDRGFATGKKNLEQNIKHVVTACTGNTSDFMVLPSPEQSINYVSCHDNLTLWDKINISCNDYSYEDRISAHKLSMGIILTSQGIPFIHSGVEICRSKYGISNTYNSPDKINNIDWDKKQQFINVYNYIKGLIKLRKNHPAFRMTDKEEIKNKISFWQQIPSNTVAFSLNNNANYDCWNKIIVIYNSNPNAVNVSIPYGTWNIVVDKYSSGDQIIRSFTADNITVEPISMTVITVES
ncbi:type I pullulanase [Clostridium sp. JN-9]|uniref:type I pullulanase n=1 Tax=Clostridium sp. JN-9 TaxID=2507159 RepID=UPI000FFE0E68|nr:type I pullulanase [Clostridium sp. JN-9]QAT39321.1 type I pullulanase [Clostridium sp. JN-9]